MKDGGPAFPHVEAETEPQVVAVGMTLRDYFAAAALTGLFASLSDPTQRARMRENGENQNDIAQACYIQADAMLKKREKTYGE